MGKWNTMDKGWRWDRMHGIAKWVLGRCTYLAVSWYWPSWCPEDEYGTRCLCLSHLFQSLHALPLPCLCMFSYPSLVAIKFVHIKR